MMARRWGHALCWQYDRAFRVTAGLAPMLLLTGRRAISLRAASCLAEDHRPQKRLPRRILASDVGCESARNRVKVVTLGLNRRSVRPKHASKRVVRCVFISHYDVAVILTNDRVESDAPWCTALRWILH